MKHLLLSLVFAGSSLAGAEACSPCDDDSVASSARPVYCIATAKREKHCAPGLDKAPAPHAKPETPRKRPALPRHLFM